MHRRLALPHLHRAQPVLLHEPLGVLDQRLERRRVGNPAPARHLDEHLTQRLPERARASVGIPVGPRHLGLVDIDLGASRRPAHRCQQCERHHRQPEVAGREGGRPGNHLVALRQADACHTLRPDSTLWEGSIASQARLRLVVAPGGSAGDRAATTWRENLPLPEAVEFSRLGFQYHRGCDEPIAPSWSELPGCRCRHRPRQRARRANSDNRGHHATGGRHRGSRRLRRAVRPAVPPLPGSGAGLRRRRRRHEARARDRTGSSRHHRDRPRGDVRQRHRHPRGRADVLPRLLRHRPARRRRGRTSRCRNREGVHPRRSRPRGRRDRRDAGDVSRRRI